MRKKGVAEERGNDIEKNTEIVHSVTLEYNKGSPKHHLTPATSGNNISDATNNIQTVAILGDSMIKHISGWEISKKLPSNTKVYIKHFSGAKTICMEDY